jgi:hypothetical protein
MTANQELYAKALEIAVLILGKQTLTANMKMSDFQMKFMDHHDLAVKTAKKIIDDAPRLIPE